MTRSWAALAILAASWTGGALEARAGEAEVISVMATALGDDAWRFDVTVRHADEGWDHYVDAFEILEPGGEVLGVRELAHPHVEEQPFTRSLPSVSIDPAIETVSVRAIDSVHGPGPAVEVDLPR